MRRIASIILIVLISFSFFSFAYSAGEKINSKTTELNFYTGMFDFSDDKQASGVLGIEHQNDELFISTHRSIISPITGGFITSKNAFYL